MFAHTVSHRTKSIKSRPLSWMTTIPECYDEFPFVPMSRTPSSRSTSSSSTGSVTPPSSRATSIIMHHSNDSEATIANDVLILQLAKDIKLDIENENAGSQISSSAVLNPVTTTLQHPMLLLPMPPTGSLDAPTLPPPSAYLDIADQNPWDAESVYDNSNNDDSSSSSSPQSPISPLSLALGLAVPTIPRRNSSRLLNAGSLTRSRSSSSVFSHRTMRSTASSATTVGGPKGKYSTRLLVQKGRVGIA